MDILECVGKLHQWDPITKQGTEPQTISAYRPFLVGRNRKTCHYVFDDQCVSSIHLRIYAIVYDFENPLEIAPLVYAQDLSTNGTFWNGQRIAKGNEGAVLLSDGDILRLSSKVFLEFRSEFQSEKPLSSIQKEEAKVFADEYLITDRILGEGSFGQVNMAVNLKVASQVACKIVDLRAVKTIRTTTNMELFELQKREMVILQKLCHPNIIALEKVILTENSLFVMPSALSMKKTRAEIFRYIFEELITAGDLFTFVESKGDEVTDFDAASIIQQILFALSYLHSQNIVHRDLKPENILMTSHDIYRRITLADFGCAQIMSSESKRMSTVIGTWDYTAPEVYRELSSRGYTKAVDLWSIGCITVVLLVGTPPFPGPTSGNIKDVEPCDLRDVFANARWDQASTWAQNFVLSLLVLDETKRLTAQVALQHPWFTNPEYKLNLEHNYEKAVRDWRPQRIQSFNENDRLIQSHSGPVDRSKVHFPSEMRGESKVHQNFHGRQSYDEQKENGKSFNQKYPTHKKWAWEHTVPEHVASGTTYFNNIRRPFSPHAWSAESFEKKPSFSFSKLKEEKILQNSKQILEQVQRPLLYTSYQNSSVPWMPILLPGSKKALKRHSEEAVSQSPEEGEVYEEIENKVTGKIQRILYKG